ncbi:MAG: dihydroxy-acid dehydratase [Candidatus Lokiarchaeota archaeon]|nr:dihydroxy-acid dehydratase [Candidatus Lokiarchaeota archaeon]MBD3340331.1 dihydroxy-acid dehydratase [Candidatus Lokiarchaeota archaeon]
MVKLTREQMSRAVKLLNQVEAYRFYWKASGFIEEDLERPIVAIANSMQDAGVGHMHLSNLARHVKEGVYAANGTPIEFNVIGPCAGYAKTPATDDITMLYDLPQREAIADSVEIQLMNYQPDGLVCICTCDKIVPGMWLGAARLNLPTLFLLGGPAMPGKWMDRKIVFPTNVIVKGLNMVLSGEMNEYEYFKEISKMESCWITGCGACPELTTANTTMIATEAMGLCLPGVSTTPGNEMEKIRQARKTGHAIMDLIKSKLRFKKVVTKNSMTNAFRAVMATSGSTNGILHLLTLAVSLDFDIDVDFIQKISETTPYISPLRPSGPYTLVDFHNAGGVMSLLNRLKNIINLDCKTVANKPIKELIADAIPKSSDVIRSVDNPINSTGGIIVLKGNLAPEGSLMRHTILKSDMTEFTGPAKCFDTQLNALMGILGGKVEAGDVMVIRFQGPRGAPGFSENFKIVLLLDALGLNDVAVITDSRFSGATEGALYVGYISPEAYVGGPLAALQEGDSITISLKNKKVEVDLTDEEIENRLYAFEPPKSRIKKGVLVEWNRSATQFHEGAMLPRKL